MADSVKSKNVRLEDLAEKTGFSISTVSAVLAGKHKKRRISEETAQRVLDAANQVQYAPRKAAHGAILTSNQIVSFYNTFREIPTSDQYMEQLLLHLHLEGARHGFALLMHSNFKNPPTDVYELIAKRVLNGLILFCPTTDDPVLSVLRENDLPSVIMNGTDPLGILHSVRDDVHSAMQAISRKLYAGGHRKVLALQENGRLVRDSEIRCLLLNRYFTQLGGEVVIKVMNSREEIPSVIRANLRSPSRPSAVFCWHDYLGYDFLSIAESMGYVIPRDFSVIGYDGVHWPDRTRHFLCTIDVNQLQLCATLFEVLTKLAQGVHVDLDQLVPFKMIEGTTFSERNL
jgi:DNA-binding LacI/PurR family transcriptional regulator